MYCRIKNIECSSAGEIELEKEVDGKLVPYKYTICYGEGGRIMCTK